MWEWLIKEDATRGYKLYWRSEFAARVSGPYKGEKVNKTGNELGTVEDFALYNLKNDFAQNEDLAAKEGKMLEEMKAEFLNSVGKYYNPNKKGETLK